MNELKIGYPNLQRNIAQRKKEKKGHNYWKLL